MTAEETATPENTFAARQNARNEEIRAAYGFLMYTERIKDEAPWAYAEARTRWLQAIVAGLELLLESPLEQQVNLTKHLVTKDTTMRQTTYTQLCAQGPVEREGWAFPWESV